MESVVTTTLEVDGMTCKSCISSINSILSDVNGIFAVDVNMNEGFVTIEHERSRVPVALLLSRLEYAGYRSRLKAG